MTRLHYILACLRHYSRTHLAVAAGVAIATAVITGALLVGDSVRGSLRGLVLERLAAIDTIIQGEQPFRTELAHELVASETPEFQQFAPLLMIPASLSTTGQATANATQLMAMGVDKEFWQLGSGGPENALGADQIAISRAVAEELGAQIGDEVLLRVGVPSNIPADSTLGEKDDARATRRLEIAAILNSGIARFSLVPSQLEPRNLFVSLTTMQRLLGIGQRVNLIAISSSDPANPTSPEAQKQLAEVFKPKLADLGLQVETLADNAYLQVAAERLVLPPALVETIDATFGNRKPQPIITYLANKISFGDKSIPYSTISGVDSRETIGPLLDDQGSPIAIANDELVLNSWAAEHLGAKVGDQISLTYYQPETTHGQLITETTAPLTVRAIVPLEDSEGKPTAAADQHLTPELPGVTDEASISDWDLPFELEEEITPADEDYWDTYRTTPKAFVSFELARRLWSTRWGTISALRIPLSAELTAGSATKQLTSAISPGELGLRIIPIKERGLTASQGTTPFEGLFLGFSFFLMASAVMLISLLFRLGAENRANEVGILQATGWDERTVRQAWRLESALVALLGATVGVLLGLGYARLMVHGLTTWWVAATVTPFLKLHVNSTSLAAGFVIGILVSLWTMNRVLKRLARLPARQLLSGDTTDPRETAQLSGAQRPSWAALACFILAVAIAVGAAFSNLGNEAQAGAFFGSGSLVLLALILWLRRRLRRGSFSLPEKLSLSGLATRNTRRNPNRTILAIALTAVASFLIVALSAFRLAPTSGGTGGFNLLATSDLPILYDLNSTVGRSELGFSADDERSLATSTIYPFRVHSGEDASCLNLYQTTQPTVLAVPDSFSQETEFAWAGVADLPQADDSSWSVLHRQKDANGGKEVIPVVLDKSTAMYSLHLSGVGSQFTIKDSFDQEVTLEVAGFLAGSIFQGKVLMSENNFLKLFPDNAGSRFFLIRCDSASAEPHVQEVLKTQLAEYGFDATDATQRLAEFLAVQNTYLSTFQSLGALGLLLGTVGLAIAQLRSAVERRGELALMRSSGFSEQRLGSMLFEENALLLVGGLVCGCLAASVATVPQYFLSQLGIPWGTLAILLGLVAGVGLAAGWLTTRAAVHTPLLPALRGD